MRNNLTGACFLLFVVQHYSLAQTTIAVTGPDAEALPTAAAGSPGAPQFIPMTRVERAHYYVKNTFSPASLLASAASAGITQWRNSPREWQQGAAGYGRRFGNAYAKNIMRQTMMYGASSLLHEDNRYLRSGQSGLGARLRYAIASTLLARRDDGTRRLSFSRVGSTAGTAFVSLLWQPPSANQAGDAATSFGISMGAQVGFNVVREFTHRRPKAKQE